MSEDIEIDGRESQERIDLLKEFVSNSQLLKHFKVVVVNNKTIGDVTFRDIAIELKFKYDAVKDMQGGALIEKVKRMKRNYKKACVIVAADKKDPNRMERYNPFSDTFKCEYAHDDDYGMHRNSYLGMKLSLAERFDCPIIEVETVEDKMWCVGSLLEKHLKGPVDVNTDTYTSIPTRGFIPFNMIRCIPGVSWKKIATFVKDGDTILDIANKSFDEIRGNKGMGPVLSQKVYDSFRTPFRVSEDGEIIL